MEIFIAQLVSGIAIGSVYAVIVTGFNLFILLKRIFHWSFAHTVIFCMYLLWLIIPFVLDIGFLGIVIGIGVTVICGILITVGIEYIFRPMISRGGYIEVVIASIGIGILFTNTMANYLNSGAPISFSNFLQNSPVLRKGLVSIKLGDIYVVVASILIVLALFYFLYQTRRGRAFRAVAQDMEVAKMLGIPMASTSVFSFAIGGLIGGISAVLLVLALGMASPGLGNDIAIKAMMLVLFAGAGNLAAGMICAIGIGIVESIVTIYIPGSWNIAITYGVILVGLLTKPEGLFKKQI
jgi:branched-chain amino acid transport system permease protein